MHLFRKISIVAFFILTGLILRGQEVVERIEPPNWWAGMEDDTLQIMLYGNDLANLNVELNGEGISLIETARVESPDYLFCYLLLSKDMPPGKFEIILKDGKKEVCRKSYPVYKREEWSRDRRGFGPEDVIYLVTPDRFANGTPENDFIPEMGDRLDRTDPQARHGGDIQGILNHLDYILQMGFTSLWLNPVLENKMPRTSYHGYTTTDYYKVDSRLGSNELYRTLGQECRKQGIKLIMDMVMNHCGSEHWWMNDLPSSDWIHNAGKYTPTNHRRSTVLDPHAPLSEKKQFTDGWFVETMPDLNQRNRHLARYLIQNSIWWVEYAHLQGIRHDTHSYPDKEFMARWSCALLREYPNLNIVGEEWSPNHNIIAYWQKDKQNPDGYTSCMPSMMDFPTEMALVPALSEPENWNTGLVKLYENLANDFIYSHPENLVVFADNHDMSRFFTRLNGDVDMFRLGMAFILTTRGIPQIFYGTEVLMHHPGSDAHGVIRSDFPGGWPADTVNAFTSEGLTKEQAETQQWMKNLLNWRKVNKAVHSGNLVHYAPENGMYVYFRVLDKQIVMVALNKSDTPSEFQLSRFSETIGQAAKGREVITGEPVDLQNWTVPARSARIVEISK
ncbi:MAG: glycoside hydrolase family 13 protein [Bacteroidales bacterium]